MSNPHSSDLESPQITCLDNAWSELSQPNLAVHSLPSLHVRVWSPSTTTHLHPDDSSSSISLHQKSNCSNVSYRYYGEVKNDAPHGFGIRIYTNSGSMEKGEFVHGVFHGLGEFTCADYGTCPCLAVFYDDNNLM
jgi:hypothetical protein